MNNLYEKKQAIRRELLKDRAARLLKIADAKAQEARKLADCIPFGQPILVGHHSEGRDRRFRGRITRTFTASMELAKKAKELEARANRIGQRGISADDPEAIRKLQRKLDGLEAHQELMKTVNRAHTRFLKNPASLENAQLTEEMKERIRTYKANYSWEPHPFAPFEMTNNNAEIRRVKARMATLRKTAAEAASLEETSGEAVTVQEFEGFSVREDFQENRVMFKFPGKPSEEIRAALKRNGFRWSPSRDAWVRQLNAAGRWAATRIIMVLTSKD